MDASGAAFGSPNLLDRILERKRQALVELNGNVEAPPRRRARVDDPAENPEDKVAVQRFTLLSRGAPPAKRVKAQHTVLLPPPRVAADLGAAVQLCRCSQCDRSGLRRRVSSGRRLCRRDTEAHPEYALLLSMTERFDEECAERLTNGESLVSEACCREKSAYFILGPGSTTIGYVAAEVAANRRVRRVADSVDEGSQTSNPTDLDDATPSILQIYVEPEFRRRGFPTEALALLLRDHNSVKVDDPAVLVLRMLTQLGFNVAARSQGDLGQPVVTLVKEAKAVDKPSEEAADAL